jgi:proteasome lid subunit RPN8/RPN11
MSFPDFTLLSREIVVEIFRSLEPSWPHEGCGFVFQLASDAGWTVLPTQNRAQMLHEKDPERYPYGGGDWFEPDMKPWFRAVREGGIPRMIFHSHPEVGAYFSDGDVDSAVFRDDDGQLHERHAGVLHMVVSVRQGQADDAALFAFSSSEQRFVELARFDAEGRRRPAADG